MEWLVKSKKANYQGNYKFHLVLSDDSIDSSSTVSIMAFTDSSQKAVVPCSYNWFIIKNGVPQEIPDFRGSSFICQTAHIGYLVQAHITSNDMEYAGKAIVTLGPVELDVSLKADILSSLSQGYNNQAVYLIGQEQEQRECTIQVYEDKMRIMHAFSDLSYTFDYSMMEPLFQYHPKEVNHLTITFNQKYERDLKKFERRLFGKEEHSMTRSTIRNRSSSNNESLKLSLRFMNRAHRDVFLYTLKGFITRRELKNSAVIHKIEKINFENNQEFSAVLLVNELRRDLVRYDRAYKKLAGERKRLQEQGFGSPQTVKSSTMLRREEPPLSGKVIQLQRQNQLLNNRIRALMQEVSNLKLVSSPPPPPGISNFKKKREHEDHTISHLLDDLNRSQQMVHFDAENQLTIERLQSEKRVMQMNLDSANQKIAYLQRRGSVPSGSVTVEKQFYNRMMTENEDLKRCTDRLEREIRLSKETIQQLRVQTERSPSKLTSPYLQRELDDLKSRLSFCEHELEETTKAKQIYQQKCINLARKVNDMENEVEMYKRNQDVMNRSQTLSDQMFDYNQEQVKLLKEHNEFLVGENQKLAKACEKYMSEAKQAIKLRQEILQLRQKLTKAYTNPQNQSFTA